MLDQIEQSNRIQLVHNFTPFLRAKFYHTPEKGARTKGVKFINFRIRELRLAKGLTQTQLSINLGLKSQSTVAMWETGARNPPSSILPRLASELDCTIDELFDRDPPGQDARKKPPLWDGGKETL